MVSQMTGLVYTFQWRVILFWKQSLKHSGFQKVQDWVIVDSKHVKCSGDVQICCSGLRSVFVQTWALWEATADKQHETDTTILCRPRGSSQEKTRFHAESVTRNITIELSFRHLSLKFISWPWWETNRAGSWWPVMCKKITVLRGYPSGQ